MNKAQSILLLAVLIATVQIGTADILSPYRNADYQMYSGEVSWTVLTEIYMPFNFAESEKPMPGLTAEEYEAFKAKQKGYRSQEYTFTCIFQGSNLLFLSHSEPGDIHPIAFDREIAFNGVSVTFVDNALQCMFRKPVVKTYRETDHGVFYYPPRACGFDLGWIQAIAKRIENFNGHNAESITTAVKTDDQIVLEGTFPNDQTSKLAVLTPDTANPDLFADIKYVNPSGKEMVHIQNQDFQACEGDVVFPQKTIITRYLKGTLDDFNEDTLIDRLTFTVDQASFNNEYADELFNPALPQGYMDLDDVRKRAKSTFAK